MTNTSNPEHADATPRKEHDPHDTTHVEKEQSEMLEHSDIKPEQDNGDTGNRMTGDPPQAASSSMLPGGLTLRGKVIGGCKIERCFGYGAMGTVYLAHHQALDIPVAVKILRPEFAKSGQQVIDRFLREARSAARLRHNHIVGVLNVGCEQDTYFIVMEYVDGYNLQKRVDREGKIPLLESVTFACHICDALEFAREAGMIHRDVKPDNILITKTGHAKLADLGLAKGVEDNSLTQDNVVIGTPYYMSPEQGQGKAVDHRSDLYSLGCTLFRITTGRLPYEEQNIYKLVLQHNEDPIPDPRDFTPAMPESFAKLIMKLMAKTVEDRYQTAQEVLKDLRRIRVEVRKQEEGEQAAAAAPGSESDLPPQTGITDLPLHGVRILVVEDSRTMGRIMAKILRDVGADVTTAENGQVALSVLKEAAGLDALFDLVISDIVMPEMDGLALLRSIREDAILRPLPVLMSTTENALDTVLECCRLQIAGYLMKPSSRGDVLDAVRRALEFHAAVANPRSEKETSIHDIAPGLSVEQVTRLHELIVQALAVGLRDGIYRSDSLEEDYLYALIQDFLEKHCPAALPAEE